MTTMEWREAPRDVAAERAAVLAEAGESTLLTAFEQTAADYAEREVHVWWDANGTRQALTYQQVRERVRDAALGLSEIGLRPGALLGSAYTLGGLSE